MRADLRMIAKSVLLAALIVAASMAPTTSAGTPREPRRIEVMAKRFTFIPAEITLKKGEPVVLVFRTLDVTHGVKFPELGLQTEIPKGVTTELSFTPDKTGDFVGHCSHFCGAGHGSMVMTLHITE